MRLQKILENIYTNIFILKILAQEWKYDEWRTLPIREKNEHKL